MVFCVFYFSYLIIPANFCHLDTCSDTSEIISFGAVVCALPVALEEGLLPGGGIALLEAREGITQTKTDGGDFNLGKRIAYAACGAPFLKILTNAGIETTGEIIFALRKAREDNPEKGRTFGYDIKTETVTDMFEAGIIDPMKVVRTALANAVSVAGTILLTECVIYDEPKKDKDDQQQLMG